MSIQETVDNVKNTATNIEKVHLLQLKMQQETQLR